MLTEVAIHCDISWATFHHSANHGPRKSESALSFSGIGYFKLWKLNNFLYALPRGAVAQLANFHLSYLLTVTSSPPFVTKVMRLLSHLTQDCQQLAHLKFSKKKGSWRGMMAWEWPCKY